jgi:Carboxypeptidase regulatory-like domain/TonB dependent receptor
MLSRGLRTLGLVLTVLLLSCPSVEAQSTYGSITGSITDPSGAVVPDAQVTLTNLGTKETRTQSSGADGLYNFVDLIPGRYRLDVEKQGFQHSVRPEVVVEVQQAVRIDVVMQLGAVAQTVEVTAQTPLLDTQTSDLGQVVEQRKATELPLNGRNIFNLTAVAPSVVLQGNSYGTPVGKNPFDFANFQVGGSFANQSAQYLDGQPLNIGYINLPLILPTQDSIGEFKVQYNNLGPEWGKFSGGVLNLSTRSGTNTWHGSAYEYLRNKVLNANEFFANAAGIPRPPFTQNQFGATGGGAPIKDKLFVFFSWEGFRLRHGQVFSTTVPTVAERSGNFADICTSGFTNGICNDRDANGNVIHQLYDPLSVNLSTGVRQPLPNNMLPSINPTSKILLQTLIPNPTNSAVTTNFIKAASLGGNTNEVVPRVDYNINDKQHLFVRFSYWNDTSLPQDPFGTGLCADRCGETFHTKAAAIGYTYSLTPTTIADLNLSGSRFVYVRLPINANYDVTKEGFPAAYNSEVPDIERTPLTPAFGIDDPLVSNSQGQSAIGDSDIQYNFSPRLTMIRGRHTLTAGAQFELSLDNYLQTNTGGGLISFNGTWTEDKARGAGNPLNGRDFADFLLGYGLGIGSPLGNQTSGAVNISAPVAGRQFYRGFYFGDNWKVTNRLTLNLGLRYDLPGPWSERFNRLTYFNPSVTNQTVTGCGGISGSRCPGDLFLVGTGVNTSNNNLPLDEHQFMPRVGFAYSLNPKTVIRAGYGIFFIPNFVSFGVNPYIDPVASSVSSFFASNDHGLTPASTLNASNCTLVSADNLQCATPGPFGPTLVVPPGRNPQPSASGYALNEQNFSATGYTVQKNGYMQQWNLDLQRQLPAGFFVDVAYAGAHGVHLPQFNPNIDQIPDSFVSQAASQAAQGLTPTIAQVVPTSSYPFSVSSTGVTGYPYLSASLAPGNLVYGQLDRPFPQYTGLNLNGQGCCSSTYNSLQLTVQRRFQGGGTLLVAYTNEKLLATADDLTSWLEGSGDGGVAGIQDWNNLKNEKSLASQDVSQRLVVSYVLDLPFGHGKKYLASLTGVADKLASGWGVDGVTTLQTGFPLKITYGGGTSLSSLGVLGQSSLRPDVVAGCNGSSPLSDDARLSEWFNTACFTAAPEWGYGTESRVDPRLRQDGVKNFDFALFKRTTFGPGERMGLEFRGEFFNIFNTPQFAAPNTNQVSPTFGQVTATIGNPRLIQFGLKFTF